MKVKGRCQTAKSGYCGAEIFESTVCRVVLLVEVPLFLIRSFTLYIEWVPSLHAESIDVMNN